VTAVAPEVAEFDSLAGVLAHAAADVVHICTPPSTHAALAHEALASNCHIYVEKPFAESRSDAFSILQAAELQQRLVCAGHQLLFERPALRAAESAAALGKLVHVESYFSFRAVRRAPGGRAPLRADLQLLDILPHPVYLLLRFLQDTADSPAEMPALQIGEAGTVHAQLRRGSTTGHLVVTLEGRPIESYLRLVGTNGALHADFVRGTIQRLFGPGTSGIDKLLAPYRVAFQTLTGTTSALSQRLLKRQRSYPGLAELFGAFYDSIRTERPAPISGESILETVGICETIGAHLSALNRVSKSSAAPREPDVVLTGGTGFLGRAVATAVRGSGRTIRVIARGLPAPWERVPGAEYVTADLSQEIPPSLLHGADVIVHAAAETAGGWAEHQKNSIDATERILHAAALAGARRFVHVSSLAVLGKGGQRAVDESTPLESDSRGSGPYVWGKLEAEVRALTLARELGIDVKVVRPGAIVDYRSFEPPGRLGKRIGPFFVAVGSPRDRLGVVSLAFTADVLAWMATNFDTAPAVLNLLDPELPRKGELIAKLRTTDPTLRVVWLPWSILLALSGVATVLQKAVRPRRPAISLRNVFSAPRYDTRGARTVAESLRHSASRNNESPPVFGPRDVGDSEVRNRA
jgi:predicted dehydrogenase/nucleoside-diphosphate-sugar epimerase